MVEEKSLGGWRERRSLPAQRVSSSTHSGYEVGGVFSDLVEGVIVEGVDGQVICGGFDYSWTPSSGIATKNERSQSSPHSVSQLIPPSSGSGLFIPLLRFPLLLRTLRPQTLLPRNPLLLLPRVPALQVLAL